MKNLRRRFIFFNLSVISCIMIILAVLVGLSKRSNLSVHQVILAVIICIGLACIGSWLLSKFALAPIKAAWQKQLDFTADASHELRTPLSTIQTNLEVVLSNPKKTVESQMKWLKNIEIENRRMSALVSDLLLLSRADTNEMMIHMDNLHLSALVSEVADIFKPVAVQNNLFLAASIEKNIVIRGDQDRLKQLLIILIDNAVKYTAPDGHIKIALSQCRGLITIEVSDTGTGIAQEEIPRVFDRFYRGKLARQYNQDGSGLGLSIAKLIAGEHGGSITIASKIGKGSAFTVMLPVNTQGLLH